MRLKAFLFALLFPFLTFSQTTVTKVIDGGAGVGKFNLMIYTPPGVTTDTVGEIFINGSGEAGTDVSKGYINGPFYWIKQGWQPPYVVAFAQTPLNYPPNRGDRPYFMIAALKELLNGGYHIDKKRFFLTGLSYGAAYIMQYMQYCPDADYVQPAGIIPMSINIYGTIGDYNKGTDALGGTDARLAKVSSWLFCGNSDAFYPAEKRYYDLGIKAGYPMTWTTYTAGHSGWNAEYDPNLKPLSTPTWIMQKAAAVSPPPVIVVSNKPPVPVITTLQAITTPTAWVLLDGSASYDSDGTIDSVAYTQVSGPSTATIIYTSCDLKGAAVGLLPGTYVFKLQMWDNKKASALSLISVTVSPAPVTVKASIPLSFTLLGTVQVTKTITIYSDGTYIIQ